MRIMQSKFVLPLATQAASHRTPAPQSNVITEEAVVKAVRWFGNGVSAGPRGKRPDLYKQLSEGKGDKPAVSIIASLCNILASGRAPPELRPFIGKTKGTALSKLAKDGSADARPA